MRTSLISLLCAGSLMLAACSGGDSTTAPPPSGPEADARAAAVATAGDAVAAELSAEIAIAPMMGFERNQPNLEDLDACTDFSGTFRNGTLTYNDCQTPRGWLNGTVTWSWDVTEGWTTVRDLTFRRGSNGMELDVDGTANWKLTLNLDGSRTIRRQGSTITARPGERVESASDLRWTWSRTQTGVTRTYPIGTATIAIFHGNPGNRVFDIALTFDGTATVLAVINGEEYTYSLIGDGPARFRKYR